MSGVRGFPDFPPVPDGWRERAAAAREGRFRYIGEEHAPASWAENPSRDKEWRIAHHKHYAAVDLARAAVDDPACLTTLRALLTSWLDTMGVGAPIESDAQVEAKRVENWLRMLALLPPGALGDRLHARLVARIGEEAHHILGHLKKTRNHRTFQLSSVVCAAVLFPDGAGGLRDEALALLTENLLGDLRPDGVHCELSSHYHNLVTETALGVVELADRNGLALPGALRERVHAAARFSLWLQWPDGDLPLVNDADAGRHQDLLRRAAALVDDDELAWGATLGAAGRPPAALSNGFPDSGYAVLRDGWGSDAQHVLYDRALLGEGSHSHYDLFSFTYFADGGPAVVDPGRYTYSSAPDADGVDWRHHFKATAAHNTVTVDGLDQTRYLSRTKHGPDVELLDAAWALGGDTDWITGTARSVEYAPLHRRTLFYPGRRHLLLVDELVGDAAEHRYQARFHLPDLVAELSVDGPLARLVGSRVRITALLPEGATATVERDWVSTEYGVKAPAAVLDLAVRTAGPACFVTVVAPRSDTSVAHLEWDRPGVVRIVRADGPPDLLHLDAGPTLVTGDGTAVTAR